jgi:hypothetical protein
MITLSRTFTELHRDWPLPGHRCETILQFNIEKNKPQAATIKHFDPSGNLLYDEQFPSKTKAYAFLKSLWMEFEEHEQWT